MRPEDRRRFGAGVALSRLLLGAHSGTPAQELAMDRGAADVDNRTASRLADPVTDIVYSVSHAGERVGVAITRGESVGVDVESLHRIPDVGAVASHVLLGSRARRGVKHDGVASFLRCWARKEAVLKATGDGLGSSPWPS